MRLNPNPVMSLALIVALSGCGGSDPGTQKQSPEKPPGSSQSTSGDEQQDVASTSNNSEIPNAQPKSSLSGTPQESIAYQLELLKAGDVEKLSVCFTERLRPRITQAMVDQGKEEIANLTLEDLVATVDLGEHAGMKTAKVMMKNGRTLTTLIHTDGNWLADTIWFR